ncbi:hypothetical protein WMF31_00125 [Sorangium sp. So ce1036]|uniref:SPW repeat domain-containing protein n=1 Tax=Sorangium sp. So ce1036 TaxID=3133328 RepID=UPI003F0EE30D
MKLLSPRLHGYIDYAIVSLLVAAPLALRFEPAPAAVCYSTALAHFIVSLLSDHPLGAARKIPFAVHGALELSFGVGLLASPWMFRFSAEGPTRTFFVATGILLVLVVMTTRYVAGVLSRPEPYDRYDR